MFGILIVFIVREHASDPTECAVEEYLQAFKQLTISFDPNKLKAQSMNNAVARSARAFLDHVRTTSTAINCEQSDSDKDDRRHSDETAQPNLTELLLQLLTLQVSMSPLEFFENNVIPLYTTTERPLSYTYYDILLYNRHHFANMIPGSSASISQRPSTHSPFVWAQYFAILLDCAQDRSCRRLLLNLDIPSFLLK